mmetsp:Transcript_16733/g.47623  ORF Transcript_16733/g.47623 Transcript_16733/m.47623 type:complete len:160 (-) Transcript_16733:122-601(-)
MGQKLAGTCWTGQFDADSQVVRLSEPVLPADPREDSQLCDGHGSTVMAAAPRGRNSRNAPEEFVQEVTDEGAFGCCITKLDAQQSPRSGAEAQGEHRRQPKPPRTCSSPQCCKESEWNSVVLISELNSNSAALQVEFVPACIYPGRTMYAPMPPERQIV